MKQHLTFRTGLALLLALGFLGGCKITPSISNPVGVRYDGTLAIALYEDGHYESTMDTDSPKASDIYVTDPEGRSLKRLTYGSEIEGGPVWSPDGEWIVYISYQKMLASEKGIWEMWVMTENGGEPRKFYKSTGEIRGVTWSPQGWEVAFFEGSGEDRRISIVDVITGEVLNQLDGVSLPPSWSPDGGQLVYLYEDKHEDEHGEKHEDALVASFDLGTGGSEVLLEGFEAIGSLEWLQDGRLIFTAVEFSGPSQPAIRTIYLYDIDSQSLAVLRADAYLVGVSPGGSQLLMFVKSEENEHGAALVTRQLDGAGDEELVTEAWPGTNAFWVTDEMVGYVEATEKGFSVIVIDLGSRESVNLTQRLKKWF